MRFEHHSLLNAHALMGRLTDQRLDLSARLNLLP
jgi:hypothetical protein